jgi:hypothetical protein
MDAIILLEYILVFSIALVAIRSLWKWLKKGKITPKEIRVQLNGQIAAIRDPVLMYYHTNPEVYGVSDDVALSASILRTRVECSKITCGLHQNTMRRNTNR